MSARVGRRLDTRLRVRGWLHLDTPLHVGAGRGEEGALDLAVDGLGRLIVPGTGLAGPLKEWAERSGRQPGRWGFAEERTEHGGASRVRVDDAVVAVGRALDPHGEPAQPAPPKVLEARSGNGIDRYTATAAAGTLRERLVVPAGLFLRFGMDIEATAGTVDDDRAHLAGLLAELAGRRVHLGGGTGGGLGRVCLRADGLEIVEEHLDSRAGLVAMMRSMSPTWTLERLTERFPPPAQAREVLTARVAWSPALPVMVAGPAGAAVNITPLTSSYGLDYVRLTLPGTAIKGALRSHAERIMRTLLGDTIAAPSGDVVDRAAAFRRQHTGELLVNLLFGAPGLSPVAPGHPGLGTGGAGAVEVEECYGTERIRRALWNSVLTEVETVGEGGKRLPASVRARLSTLGMDVATHNSIDRWTGGTAPQALFTVLEPHGVTWSPIEITVDLARLRSGHPVAARAAAVLLTHVLYDLRAGLIPLGYGANRGLGEISVRELTVTGPAWPGGTDLDGALSGALQRRLVRSWGAYLTWKGRR